MSVPLLLLSRKPRWFGTARMPRTLQRAGFDVSLVAPAGSLAEHSRYVRRVIRLAEDATPLQWAIAVEAVAESISAQLLVPADDVTLRLMQSIVLHPPQGLDDGVRDSLAARVVASLGDPRFYRTSIDKTLFAPAVEALGVPVPPGIVVSSIEQARGFLAEHGYPVVVKRSHSTAGSGVELCAGPAALEQAFTELRRPQALVLGDADDTSLLLQAFVSGRNCYTPSVGWKGEVVAGFCSDKLAGGDKAPSTVARNFHSAAMRDALERIARAFGLSGFFSVEFIAEPDGTVRAIELNRRLTHGMHRGSVYGVDLAAGLLDAMQGRATTTRTRLDDREEYTYAHFPQEWLRDRDSTFLVRHPVDVPWDDPRLIEAMLRLRHEH